MVYGKCNVNAKQINVWQIKVIQTAWWRRKVLVPNIIALVPYFLEICTARVHVLLICVSRWLLVTLHHLQTPKWSLVKTMVQTLLLQTTIYSKTMVACASWSYNSVCQLKYVGKTAGNDPVSTSFSGAGFRLRGMLTAFWTACTPLWQAKSYYLTWDSPSGTAQTLKCAQFQLCFWRQAEKGRESSIRFTMSVCSCVCQCWPEAFQSYPGCVIILYTIFSSCSWTADRHQQSHLWESLDTNLLTLSCLFTHFCVWLWVVHGSTTDTGQSSVILEKTLCPNPRKHIIASILFAVPSCETC